MDRFTSYNMLSTLYLQGLVQLATSDPVALHQFSAYLTGILDYLSALSLSQV